MYCKLLLCSCIGFTVAVTLVNIVLLKSFFQSKVTLRSLDHPCRFSGLFLGRYSDMVGSFYYLCYVLAVLFLFLPIVS